MKDRIYYIINIRESIAVPAYVMKTVRITCPALMALNRG